MSLTSPQAGAQKTPSSKCPFGKFPLPQKPQALLAGHRSSNKAPHHSPSNWSLFTPPAPGHCSQGRMCYLYKSPQEAKAPISPKQQGSPSNI